MKTLILDTVVAELKEKNPAELFGSDTEETMIICSSSPKEGFKKVAVCNEESESFPSFSFAKGEITSEGHDIEIIRYSTDFQSRNKGLTDISILQEVTVALFGIGSGGSTIAETLLRSGVINLILSEFDTVSTSNICRSTYDITDIGQNKTEALKKHLLKINPFANIQIHNENVLEMDFEKLVKIIEDSDLIIECTDNEKTKIRINGLAHKSTPVLYPGVYPEGKGGDIAITLPGLPCYECIFHSVLNSNEDEGEKQQWDYTNDKPKPMPGLLADIQVICARTAKLALGILTADQEDSFIDKIIEPGCTLLLIGNQTNKQFEKPFQEVWLETEINPTCTCQTLK